MFEFTFDSFSDEQRDAYLARIGFREETSVCKQTLDRLVYLHQCSVPFEDLDPVLGVDPLPLDAQSLFDKIVTRRRGGFCFELNGAFMLLLRASVDSCDGKEEKIEILFQRQTNCHECLV